jgi:FAD/FMN-containing dehydrogenase
MPQSFSPLSPSFLSDLKDLLGANWKSVEPGSRYLEDPRHTFVGQAHLIALPTSTQQVSEVVKLCNQFKAGIIPYGGGTGVVAGQLSPSSENAIIVSLEKMNAIRSIDKDESMMVVEAGCILETLHTATAEHKLHFPLSMASKGSCSIGGNLATNAGGIQVLRYGNARDLCLGIEAVLPNGDIISELSPLRKNNTGYDLRHLLIGSEGTLGIITAASLQLEPIDPEGVTVLCAVPSPAAALSTYHTLRRSLGNSIAGLELMSGFGMKLVTHHFPKLKYPFDGPHPWYLLVEVTGHVGIRERLEETLAKCFDNDLVIDAVVAESQTQRANLWDLRENTPEANQLEGAICNSDTAVPISKVDAFIEATTKLLTAIDPALRLNSYGHIGDGNIHHNVFPMKGMTKKEFTATQPETVEAVRMAINEATARFNGTVSAEHGIGRLKLDDLERYVSQSRRDAMKAIKGALDPNNIMNPGALIN